MSIISISRGSYSKGKEIAEKLADKLGYECISRDVLIEASDHFNVPEIKLIRALHDSPSILDRFTSGKQRYVSYIREAILEHVQRDNVVYHGLAGHFFLKGVPHVLKVRIIANMEDRIQEEMKRENISEDKARYTLKKDDDERRKWAISLYGMDTADANLYDLVLHIDNLQVDDAVNTILHMVQLPCFQTTAEAKQILDNKVLAARVHAIVISEFPAADIRAEYGVVFASIEAPIIQEDGIVKKIYELTSGVEGMKQIKVNVVPQLTAY
jgi:cytidylate kinase